MSKSHLHARKGKASRTYRIWTNMKNRCSNPRASNFAWYGGRGITFDPSWASFEAFLADMGEAPIGLTLDRKDGNGPYCKDNCRWATYLEQQNNKESNRVLEYKGKTLTLAELARLVGIRVATIWGRLERGYTVEDAVERPLRGTVPCVHGALKACRECRLENAAAWRRSKGIPEQSPPSCPKGHLFTPETTKMNNGARVCRVCAREYMRAYNARKKATEHGVTAGSEA